MPTPPPGVPPPGAAGASAGGTDLPPSEAATQWSARLASGVLLPDVEVPDLDDRERSLAPAVVTSWRITTALSLLFPTVALTVVGFLVLDWRYGLGALAAMAALAALLVGVYPAVRFRRWRWQLTGLGLELSRGVITRYHEAVPYFRIQQIDIVQGPLDRLLRLATLQVTTASASGAATLPGIAHADAPGVRAALLARAAHAVAEHPGDLRDAV